MSPRFLAPLAAALVALPAFAHITPNVELVKKSAFVAAGLPGAEGFFAKDLGLDRDAEARIRQATGWKPTSDEAKVYVGRDAEGQRVGAVVLLWIASQHGPVGLGVAFDREGKVRSAAVTDVASEPLVWVRPLLDNGEIPSVVGLARGESPDPAKIAPAVKGAMPRYYARVLAEGVERAQALEVALFGR